jgi:uncharacterized phage protein gp47/JayE
MAYENMTYEIILQRMMNRVTYKYPNLDNREGSIIFNALAPAALELAIAYSELDNVLAESFVDTASREYILRGCQQMGMDITQFEAKAGTHKGVFNVEVEIGSRWNCELYNYVVTSYIGKEDEYFAYEMLCETLGTSPNKQTGDLTAITDVPNGLEYAKLIECLIEGENVTSDEDIKQAYFDHVNSTAYDGNVAQYVEWCKEFDGIGNARIFPLWNGDNTVKVSILSASNKKASDTLIEDFQNFLDPGTTGMGDGVAPIGAFVTVTTAEEVPIDVSATITFKAGYADTSVLETELEEYLSGLAYKKNTVGYMNIGAIILNYEGIEAVNDLTVNGGTSNVMLSDEQIPVVGTLTWAVSGT